jgi:hypothetical protein
MTMISYQTLSRPEWNIPGLFAMGTHPAMIVKAPFRIPEDPIPAIALPKINIIEEVEMAQINEPNSKRAKKTMKVH